MTTYAEARAAIGERLLDLDARLKARLISEAAAHREAAVLALEMAELIDKYEGKDRRH
jgi:hypothetical protein